MRVPLRSRDDLIAAFPNLGSEGAMPEARAALILAGPRYQVLDDGFDDPEILAALKPWSGNNSAMVRLSEARFETGHDAARREAIKDRLARLASCGPIEGDVPGGAEKWVDLRLAALDVMARSGRAFSEFDKVYRGAATYSDLFDATFSTGKKVRWRGLTACTLDPEYTPIHYAWKQRDVLIETAPPGDVTSYILEIRLDAQPLPPLVWTGAVVGDIDASTYRWQAEVVTPPGFEFEVTSVKQLNVGSLDRLLLVRAEYVPPV